MRPQLFLDMDDTFYNWRAMLEPIRENLRQRGYSDERFDRALECANADGFSFVRLLVNLGNDYCLASDRAQEFERHLHESGRHCLFPRVENALWKVSRQVDISLLTFGYPPYQKAKWAGLKCLHPYFSNTHFVYRDRSKGEVIASATDENTPVFFCDDSPAQLLDVLAHAPWCKCARMRHRSIASDDHEGDGVLWSVVRDMPEMIAWTSSHLSGVRVSFAQAGEYEEIVGFINSRGKNLLMSGELRELDNQSRARLFDNQHSAVAVARDASGRLVGTAMMYLGQTWRKLIGHIEYVLVDEDYQGQGIATMLLCALHDRARSRGASMLKLTCEEHREKARSLYIGLFGYGFEKFQGYCNHFVMYISVPIGT